jgi:hypothetical protein
MTKTPALFAALTALAVAPSTALACSCLAPSVESSYNTSDHAVIGRVMSRTILQGWHVYDVRVLRDLKDSQPRGTVVRIATPDNQAACGDSFNVNQNYVLFASDQRIGGQPRWVTNYCRNNAPLTTLDPDQMDFLRSREIVDPTGTLVCADPSIPLTPCLIDPCTTAPACPNGTCEANYCGGCNAEFYDPFGYAVCTP